MTDGNFLCIVGIDGSGKSDLTKSLTIDYPEFTLADWHQFNSVTQLGLIGDGLNAADVIRQLGSLSRSALILYLVSLEYDLVIKPALASHKTVIADSYWYKFAAKEQIIGLAPMFFYEALNSFPSPNRVFFIDTPPAVAFVRKGGVINSYEGTSDQEGFMAFQERVKANILAFIKNVPHTILDGNQTTSELKATIMQECRFQ